MFLGDVFVISLPFKVIVPLFAFAIPVKQSISSVWPFPSTPAIPSISPARSSRSRPFKISTPRRSFAQRSSTFKTTPPISWSFLSTLKLTLRPTIFSANIFSSTSFTLSLSIYSPRLIIVQWSAIAFISASLWVIIIIDLSILVNLFIISINSFISCGVKTAVGSSNISISAPLYKAFKISTLCCWPTEISSTFAFGSIISPYSSESFSIFSRAVFLSKNRSVSSS